MRAGRFDEIAGQIESLLIQGNALCLERAQPLMRELSGLVISMHPAKRGGVQAELRLRAILWERLLQGAYSFMTGWGRASAQIPETYTAEGGLRTSFSFGRLRVDG